MTQIDEWLKQAGELADADKVDEAAELCSRILTLEPDNYRALYVIGSVMLKVGRNGQAQQHLRRVCELRPNSHQGWGQLSISCAEMHRYDEAIRCAEKALRLKPECRTYADASFAHTTAGNWARGREFALESLKLDPTFKDAIFHLANCDLAEQRWVEGWEGFKVSEGSKWRKKFIYGDTEEWQGEQDAVVMVTGEQGLGDEIMMAGLIPDASRSCKQFIFDCDSRIAGLFARSFPNVIVTPTRRSQHVALPIAPTHHKTLFGLAQMFRRQNSDFPRTPYLQADPKYRRMFRSLLDSFGSGPKIGIAWSGGFPRTGQVERTAGVSAFLPLIQGEPAAYISLQYKDDASEIIAFEQKTGCHVMRLPWVMQGQDVDILASFIAELDEVIGVHTAALHLSSALDVRTTTLSHRGSGWRYAPDELLWYPKSTRQWKKDRGESWRECIGQLVRHRTEQRKEAA